MNYVISLMKEIVRKRKLIWDLAKADFRKRFVGSYFWHCLDAGAADCYGTHLLLHLPGGI